MGEHVHNGAGGTRPDGNDDVTYCTCGIEMIRAQDVRK